MLTTNSNAVGSQISINPAPVLVSFPRKTKSAGGWASSLCSVHRSKGWFRDYSRESCLSLLWQCSKRTERLNVIRIEVDRFYVASLLRVESVVVRVHSNLVLVYLCLL